MTFKDISTMWNVINFRNLSSIVTMLVLDLSLISVNKLGR